MSIPRYVRDKPARLVNQQLCVAAGGRLALNAPAVVGEHEEFSIWRPTQAEGAGRECGLVRDAVNQVVQPDVLKVFLKTEKLRVRREFDFTVVISLDVFQFGLLACSVDQC